jgi:hypothetical protein
MIVNWIACGFVVTSGHMPGGTVVDDPAGIRSMQRYSAPACWSHDNCSAK